MKKTFKLLIFNCLFPIFLFGQSESGFSLSATFSQGDLISGEYNPRIVRTITSRKILMEYTLVEWDNTLMRLGLGYHFLKENENRFKYLFFPIVFQRYLKENKRGFNTSLVFAPSITKGRPRFYNTTIVDFNLELSVRAGTTFDILRKKINIEAELSAPLSTLGPFGTLSYLTYGIRFSLNI